MTSLPIQIPPGYDIVVTQGDQISVNQVVAKKKHLDVSDETPSSIEPHYIEVPIDVPGFFSISVDKARTLIKKNPGDSVRVGDVLASKSTMLGTKKEELVSQMAGTVLRFERATGKLVIRTETVEKPNMKVSSDATPDTIVSPLAGKVSLCNNDEIVLEVESAILSGNSGTGSTVQGEVVSTWYKSTGDTEVSSFEINATAIEKIIVVAKIGKEALAKAAAIGVLGVIASDIAESDISYMNQKHKDFPIVHVDESLAKKIATMSGKIVALDGLQKTVMISE